MGSAFAARLAGQYAATPAVIIIRIAAAANVGTSSGLIAYSWRSTEEPDQRQDHRHYGERADERGVEPRTGNRPPHHFVQRHGAARRGQRRTRQHSVE